MPAPPSNAPRNTIAAFLDRSGGPRVIAHRGLSGLLPENTVRAFAAALDAGAEMIELDVFLARDGVPMVLHDRELDRTTDGQGAAARQSSDELRALDAGSWFAPDYSGERIPTLAEVLALVRGRALVNVEIKGEAVTRTISGGVVERTIEVIRAADMHEAALLSSFEPRALRQAREIDAEIARASLLHRLRHLGKGPAQILADAESRCFNVGVGELKPGMIEQCHASGAPILVYTVNDPAEMEKLFAMGVDGVFTDRVDLGLELLRDL